MKQTKFFLVFSLSLATMVCGKQETESTPVPGTKPIKNLREVPPPRKSYIKKAPTQAIINRYGNLRVVVFQNEDVKEDETLTTEARWHFAPLPLIDLKKLQSKFEELQELQKKASDNRPGKVLTLEFELSFENTELAGLIAEQLSLKRKTPVPSWRVESLPDEVIRRCYANIGGKTQIIYSFPDEGAVEDGASDWIQPPPLVTANVTGTLDELSKFVKNPIITEKCVAGAWTGKLSFIGVTLRNFAKTDFAQKLKGGDKMKNEVTISSEASGGGGGLDIGGVLSFGGAASGSNAKTTVDVHRWVDRQQVLKTMNEYYSGLDTAWFSEFKVADHDQSRLKEMVDRITQRAEHVQLDYKEQKGNTLKFVDQQNNEVLVTVGKINDVQLANNASITVNKGSTTSGNVGAYGGSQEKHLNLTITNDPHAEHLGTPIIPTTVDLYQINDAVLDGVVKETAGGVEEATPNTNIPLVAAYVEREAPIFDVGMIIASMIPWQDYSAEFKRAWVPCDGRVVPGSDYEKMRLKTLGNGDGWKLDAVNESIPEINEYGKPKKNGKTFQKQLERKVEREAGEIHVPDLRGQFLRGLNVFVDEMKEGPVKGPRADGRQAPSDPKDPAKPEGEKKAARQAGDWQEEEFKRHNHRILTYNDDFNWGGGEHPPSFSRNDAPHRNWAYTTEPEGGSETRPSNVAVYYYIKVN